MQITSGGDAKRRVYDIGDWVFAYPDSWTIAARPGLRAFLRRLVLMALVTALAGGILAPLWNSKDSIVYPLQVFAGAMVGLCLVYVAAVFWQRMEICRQNDRLVVRARFFVPRTWSHAVSELRGMNVLEQELRSAMKSGHRRLGWRWRVLVHSDEGGYEFWCDHQGQRSHTGSAPQRVVDFVRHLQHITGLACAAPQTIEWRSGRQGAFSTGRTFVTTSQPAHERHTYHSLDEMPPDVRERAEAAMVRMRAQGVNSFEEQRYTVADSDGNVRTYHSLDEMPPELRDRFEAARRSSFERPQ